MQSKLIADSKSCLPIADALGSPKLFRLSKLSGSIVSLQLKLIFRDGLLSNYLEVWKSCDFFFYGYFAIDPIGGDRGVKGWSMLEDSVEDVSFLSI